MSDTQAIFVSHASADWPKARFIRKYLEDKGARPILSYAYPETAPAQLVNALLGEQSSP